MSDLRVRHVRFVDQKLFDAYKKLGSGTFEEKHLQESIQAAIADLKKKVKEKGAFIESVLKKPKVWLAGDEKELVALVKGKV